MIEFKRGHSATTHIFNEDGVSIGYVYYGLNNVVTIGVYNPHRTKRVENTGEPRLPKDRDDFMRVFATLLKHTTGGELSAQAIVAEMFN